MDATLKAPPTRVVQFNLVKAFCEDWAELQKGPVKWLLSHHPTILQFIVDVYHRESNDHLQAFKVRMTMEGVNSILPCSGRPVGFFCYALLDKNAPTHRGLWIRKEAVGTPDADYLAHVTLLARQHRAEGILWNGKVLGLRIKVADYEATYKAVFPDKVFLKEMLLLPTSFRTVEGFALMTSGPAVRDFLAAWGWEVRILDSCVRAGARSFRVGAEKEPPSRQAILGGDSLIISPAPAKQSKRQKGSAPYLGGAKPVHSLLIEGHKSYTPTLPPAAPKLEAAVVGPTQQLIGALEKKTAERLAALEMRQVAQDSKLEQLDGAVQECKTQLRGIPAMEGMMTKMMASLDRLEKGRTRERSWSPGR